MVAELDVQQATTSLGGRPILSQMDSDEPIVRRFLPRGISA